MGQEKLCLAGAALVLFGCLPCNTANANQDAGAKSQYVKSCGTCHAAEPGLPHRQGPNLYGVFGRKAASLSDFKYSPALKNSGLTWDEATLEKWIEDAQAMLPGTSMAYRQRDPDKRKLIIDYLKLQKP